MMLRSAAIAALLMSVCLHARQLPVRVLTMAQGLPRNAVACIVPGPGEVIWLCTSEGLAQFDGYQFRTFGPDDGLPSRVIIQAVPSKTGGYWLVTDRGMCRLSPQSRIGEPCRLLPVDDLAGEYVTVFESRTGAIWAATTDALYRVSPHGRLERTDFRPPEHEGIEKLGDGRDGGLLIGTQVAVYDWAPARGAHRISEAPLAIEDIFALPSGDVLLGTTRGLFRVDIRNLSLHKIDIPGMYVVHHVLRRRDNSIWISGNLGICRMSMTGSADIRASECYSEQDGLPFNVLFLAEDAQGDLWGTTESSGIFRLAENGIVAYGQQDGLGDCRIASIFEDKSGRVCVMIGDRGAPAVRVHTGATFEPAVIPFPDNLPYYGWGWNQLGYRAHDMEWWFRSGPGVLRFHKPFGAARPHSGPPRIDDSPAALGCSSVYALFEDSAGDVWVTCFAAGPQLARWERRADRFHLWRAADGWPDQAMANVIRETSGGVFWIGTNDSVVRFRENRFEAFHLNYGPRVPIVRDLLVDRDGRIWIATQRAGLLRCDNPTDPAPVFHPYTVSQGMSSNSVRALVQDLSGFIYAGTVRGVDRIDPAAPIGAGRIQHLTTADGLPDGDHNAAFRDRRGHLWFGTLRGLAEFDPTLAPAPVQPQVRLTRLRVRGQEVRLPWEGAASMSLELAANRNQVEIEYTSVDLRSTASIRYQYRLSGVDNRWSDPSPQRTVNFASMPAGRLRFEVRALGSDGRASKPAELMLLVQAALWRRWWFVFTVLARAAAIAAALYNYRVRHLLAIERLRTRIATDLHDDIGASLTQISILSEVARRGAAPQLLSDIADMARGMVQEMSDIVWAVNPRHDQFDALVHRMRRFASDTLEAAHIDVHFETEGISHDYVAPLEARRPLYLVFKEAVNNVVKHSGASKAIIRLALDGGALKLEVIDDGRGFDTSKPYSGEGLSSIPRRMRALGGNASWESIPHGGTRFIAVLPLGTPRLLHMGVHRVRP